MTKKGSKKKQHTGSKKAPSRYFGETTEELKKLDEKNEAEDVEREGGERGEELQESGENNNIQTKDKADGGVFMSISDSDEEVAEIDRDEVAVVMQPPSTPTANKQQPASSPSSSSLSSSSSTTTAITTTSTSTDEDGESRKKRRKEKSTNKKSYKEAFEGENADKEGEEKKEKEKEEEQAKEKEEEKEEKPKSRRQLAKEKRSNKSNDNTSDKEEEKKDVEEKQEKGGKDEQEKGGKGGKDAQKQQEGRERKESRGGGGGGGGGRSQRGPSSIVTLSTFPFTDSSRVIHQVSSNDDDDEDDSRSDDDGEQDKEKEKQGGSVVLVMDANQRVVFGGSVMLKVLGGAVKAFGAVLHPALPHPTLLFSSLANPTALMFFEAMLPETRVALSAHKSSLRAEPGPSNPSADSPSFSTIPGFYPLLESPYGGVDYKCLQTPAQWVNAAHYVLNHPTPPKAMLYGGRNAGKSTFARFLINTLLNKYEAVTLLDFDVGQTECGPPAFVSLNVITSPLLGPPYTHLMQPLRSYYLGDVSPGANPGLYLHLIHNLHNYLKGGKGEGEEKEKEKDLSKYPVVINTPGWVSGLGLELLSRTADITSPTHLIHLMAKQDEVVSLSAAHAVSGFSLTPPPSSSPLPSPLPSSVSSSASDSSLPSLSSPSPSLSTPSLIAIPPRPYDPLARGKPARDLRNICLASYFGVGVLPLAGLSNSSKPEMGAYPFISGYNKVTLSSIGSVLASQTPFCVSWKDLGFYFETAVDAEEALVALNGSIVALCAVDTTQPHLFTEEVGPQGVRMWKGKPPPSMNNAASPYYPFLALGLGIVRAINVATQSLYILTPIEGKLLSEVRVLVKGPLELPSEFIFGVSGSGGGRPYTVDSKTVLATGVTTQPMKSRDNIQRGQRNFTK